VPCGEPSILVATIVVFPVLVFATANGTCSVLVDFLENINVLRCADNDYKVHVCHSVLLAKQDLLTRQSVLRHPGHSWG